MFEFDFGHGEDLDLLRENALVTQEELMNRIATDPHSPSEFRANGVVRNIDAWYEAFDVGPNNALYLPPGSRVSIW